jgi:hypothetical protein
MFLEHYIYKILCPVVGDINKNIMPLYGAYINFYVRGTGEWLTVK